MPSELIAPAADRIPELVDEAKQAANDFNERRKQVELMTGVSGRQRVAEVGEGLRLPKQERPKRRLRRRSRTATLTS